MTATMLPPWIAIGVFAAAMASLIAILTVVQHADRLSAEAIRKLFHLGSGAAALSLPWLFSSLWPVLVLAFVSMLGFLALRVVPALRAGPGQILQSVSRKSIGEFSFLLGVLTIYAIAGDDVVVYSIGILVLAVADTAAALVGIFYGQHTYDVPGGRKSTEGSSAFLLTAFLCVHVPLLLFTETGRPETLLIALNTAGLLMLAEADAARGIDNFVLPVVVVLLLELFLEMTTVELLAHSAVIISLGGLVFSHRKRTTLSPDALIGAALAGYVFWLFGGWQWLVAPFVLFATYTPLVGRPALESSRPFHADVLLVIIAPGMVLATLYAVLDLKILYLPYVAVWSANLAVIGTLHGWLKDPHASTVRLAVVNAARTLVVLIPGYMVADELPIWAAVAALGSVFLALALTALIKEKLVTEPARPAVWIRVALSVSASTLLNFLVIGGLQEQLA